MGITNYGSAIRTGSGLGNGDDSGFVVLSKSVVVDHVVEAGAGSDNVDVVIKLPPGSQIIELYVDTLTAWNSVTSAGLTVGSTAGGAEYCSSVDVKSAGREVASYTAAQLAALDDIGANTSVYVRVAQVGNTSAGQARVTVLYSQKM